MDVSGLILTAVCSLAPSSCWPCLAEQGQIIGRMPQSAPSCYTGYRFPPAIIGHANFRFPLSLRMVEEMLAARGIVVSHEAVRQWALKFGQGFANEIRRRLPRAGDKWHLDEVVIKIAGTTHWLWRAVDQHGIVLDVLVQSRRDAKAAKRLLRKLLKRQGRAPRVMITDKLASYPGGREKVEAGRSKRRSGSHGSAGDRGPDVEGSGAGSSVLVGGDVIAAEVEEVVDRLVRCQESLRPPCGLEPLGGARPLAGDRSIPRLMACRHRPDSAHHVVKRPARLYGASVPRPTARRSPSCNHQVDGAGRHLEAEQIELAIFLSLDG